MLTTPLLLLRLSIHGQRPGSTLATSNAKVREVGLDPPRLFHGLGCREHVRPTKPIEPDIQYPDPLPLLDDRVRHLHLQVSFVLFVFLNKKDFLVFWSHLWASVIETISPTDITWTFKYPTLQGMAHANDIPFF